MLTPDVRFDGFSTHEWTTIARAFRPAPESTPGAKRGGLICVTQGGRLVKALSTLDPNLSAHHIEWPTPLKELAEAQRHAWAVQFEWGALDEVCDRWARRLAPDHDAFAQAVELVSVLQEAETEGLLQSWPWHVSTWPIPNAGMRGRALNAVCPDGKVMVLGLFDNGKLETSVSLRRRGDGIDWIHGPSLLRESMGLLSGDWTRDYLHLLRAVEESMGEVAIGCFGELRTFRRISARPTPGAWAAAVASRDVVLSPAVPAVAIPLGIDLGRAAFFALRDFADRLGAGSWLTQEGPLGPAIQRVRSAAMDRDVVGLLGFDPVDLLRKLLAWRNNSAD